MEIKKQVEELSPESRKLFQDELLKYGKYINLDFKSLTPEQLTQVITGLQTEETQLNNKIIQLETQIQEKQKQLEIKEAEIFKKYDIASILELETKKQSLEMELQTLLSDLKGMLV